MNIEYKKFNPDLKMPTKTHELDGGLDMFLPECIIIKPLETKVVSFGIGFQIPKNYIGIFVPRSSIAAKGLIIQPAIVDPGYTGETHLIITNCSSSTYEFNKNDRLCSLIVVKAENVRLSETSDFESTDRGNDGLGSSGK